MECIDLFKIKHQQQQHKQAPTGFCQVVDESIYFFFIEKIRITSNVSITLTTCDISICQNANRLLKNQHVQKPSYKYYNKYFKKGTLYMLYS